jgi:hypothetical protein
MLLKFTSWLLDKALSASLQSFIISLQLSRHFILFADINDKADINYGNPGTASLNSFVSVGVFLAIGVYL